MARQTSAVELSNFVAGLITEASPLTFPPNASLDEQNFVLRRDGSRRRRLGVDLEEGAITITTGVTVPASGEVAFQSFKWQNAGGDPSRNLIAIQTGNELRIFDSSVAPISSSALFTKVYTGVDSTKVFSFAAVDGILVVATGTPEISSLEYKDGVITTSSSRLLVRDLFGVADTVGGVDLRVGSGITTRPVQQVDTHIYNLRNQTWGPPRKVTSNEGLYDLIFRFQDRTGVFPSNADVITYSLYPDAQDSNDRLTDRFNWRDVAENPIGTTPAPKGSFIIDALDRGISRLSEESKLRDRYPILGYEVSDLPKDSTPSGATIITEYAGRVFYTGFSGEVIDGDDNSPKMSSYILFSKLVEDLTDINICYQLGDPTSKQEPDLVDTDGGFIRIDGAYGILGMVNVGDALMIIASNGVWLLRGGSEFGFKATNYLVSKITTYGCSSPSSIAQIDTSVMYWGEDGIYVVAQNQFGDYVADNMTQKTIQTYYEDIDSLDRRNANAAYDSFERKVYWTYGNRINSTDGVKQLVFDTTLGAFYPFVLGGNKYPMLVAGVQVPPYRLAEVADDVTVNGVQVTVSGLVVSVTDEIEQASFNETAYLTITSVSPTVEFSFAVYRDTTFRDWKSIDTVGFDARAFLLTGWQSGGDFQRYKQVPYVTFHFIKTEDGFTEEVGGDWAANNPSSCLVSAQWDWANHINSGRWGRQFQAYRFNRHYFPSSLSDGFDNGFYTVVTKNKLRGKGRVLSLLIETEPDKDCYLLGWSMVMSVNGNV